MFAFHGDAYEIDRILHGFARRYHQLRPIPGLSEEQLYVLVSACTLLNTDLHSAVMCSAASLFKHVLSFFCLQRNAHAVGARVRRTTPSA